MKNIKKLVPIKSYLNLIENKKIIYKENLNKSGIYCWINIINNKIYIGSSSNLSKRFKNYFSLKHIKNKLLKSRSKIYSSILKYSYNNFRLEILEYCKLSVLLKREQYYIDLLKPHYNICKKAGSPLGRKHTPETILKLKKYKSNREILFKLKNSKL